MRALSCAAICCEVASAAGCPFNHAALLFEPCGFLNRESRHVQLCPESPHVQSGRRPCGRMLDSPLRQKDNQRYDRRNQNCRRVGAAEREAAEIVRFVEEVADGRAERNVNLLGAIDRVLERHAGASESDGVEVRSEPTFLQRPLPSVFPPPLAPPKKTSGTLQSTRAFCGPACGRQTISLWGCVSICPFIIAHRPASAEVPASMALSCATPPLG